MNSISEFRESLNDDQPPKGLTDLLQALWWEAKGDWEKAHKIAQDITGADAAWIHAYLHRKEGSDGNASYWYSYARKPESTQSLDDEWEQIVDTFLRN